MLNKTTLIGRLGAQPEMKTSANGVAITKFSLATSETFKDKQGQKQEETEWHRIVLFGRVAEIANQYLNKGDLVYLEGKNKTQKWQDSTTGQDRYTTEVICNEMKMLGSPSSPSTQGNSQQQQQRAPQQQQRAPQQRAPQQQQRPQQQYSAPPTQQYQQAPQQHAGNVHQGGYANQNDQFDDDIPF